MASFGISGLTLMTTLSLSSPDIRSRSVLAVTSWHWVLGSSLSVDYFVGSKTLKQFNTEVSIQNSGIFFCSHRKVTGGLYIKLREYLHHHFFLLVIHFSDFIHFTSFHSNFCCLRQKKRNAWCAGCLYSRAETVVNSLFGAANEHSPSCGDKHWEQWGHQHRGRPIEAFQVLICLSNEQWQQ